MRLLYLAAPQAAGSDCRQPEVGRIQSEEPGELGCHRQGWCAVGRRPVPVHSQLYGILTRIAQIGCYVGRYRVRPRILGVGTAKL